MTHREFVARDREVVHVNRLAINNGPSGSPSSRNWPLHIVDWDWPVMSSESKQFALSKKYHRVVRFADSDRRLHQRIEHRLQMERGAADDLEHLGRGGLLFSALGKLAGLYCEHF